MSESQGFKPDKDWTGDPRLMPKDVLLDSVELELRDYFKSHGKEDAELKRESTQTTKALKRILSVLFSDLNEAQRNAYYKENEAGFFIGQNIAAKLRTLENADEFIKEIKFESPLDTDAKKEVRSGINENRFEALKWVFQKRV